MAEPTVDVMGPRQGFRYNALSDATRDVRLLAFNEHTGHDSIHLDLVNFDLDEAPPYTAVSYAWGLPAAQSATIINKQPFDVRPNCLQVLQQLWQQNTLTMWFWIDAICINQDDDDEKAAQVQRMTDIYSCAESVVLSCSSLTTRTADFLSDLSQSGWDRSEGDIDLSDSRRAGMLDAFTEIGENPYWSRLWTIQELYFAKKQYILLSSTTITLEKLFKLLQDAIVTLREPLTMRYVRFFEAVTQMRGTLAIWLGDNRRDRMDIHHVLMRFGSLECSVRLDRIYGLYSLMDWNKHRCTMKVDYTISPLVLAIRFLATWPDTLAKDIHNMNLALEVCKNLLPSLNGHDSGWIYSTLRTRCNQYASLAAKIYSSTGPRSLEPDDRSTALFSRIGTQLRTMVPIRVDHDKIITKTDIKDGGLDDFPHRCRLTVHHPAVGPVAAFDSGQTMHCTFATAPKPGDVVFRPDWMLASPSIVARPASVAGEYVVVGFLTPWNNDKSKAPKPWLRRDAQISLTEQPMGTDLNTYIHVDGDDLLVMVWLYNRLWEQGEPMIQSCFTPEKVAQDTYLGRARNISSLLAEKLRTAHEAFRA